MADLTFKLLSNKYSKLKVKCLMPFLLLIYYLVGIGWDLPSNLNGDECISLNAMYTIKNNYGNHDLRFYGSPYIYLNTILVGFYFLLSYILGLCKNTNDFIINFIKDPTIIILIGRMISVFCGILLFFVIKKLSKKLNKKDPNIYPSLLFCVSSLAIYWIHFAKLDIMAALLFNLSLLYIIKSLKSEKSFIIACILTGLSITCKLPSIVLVNGLLVVFFFYFKEREKDKIKLMFKLVCSLLFGIFIGDPWAIIDYRSGINQILITRELFAYTTETTNIDQILYYLNVLKSNYSMLFVLLLIIIPLGYILKKPEKKEIPVLVVLVSFIILLMSTNHTAGHWLLPIIPSLIIIYISSLNKIIDRLNWQYLHYTKHIFCAYILIHTTLVGFDGLNKQFLLPDTKYMAKEWIESNLPESTKVAMDRGRYLSTFNANLIPNDSSIKRQLQKDFTIDQDFLTSNGKIFIEAQRFHPSSIKKFDIYPIIHGETDIRQKLRVRNQKIDISALRNQKIRYLLVSDGYFGRYFQNKHANQSKNYFEMKNFYEKIFNELKIVKEWKGDELNFKGPHITLFQID